MKTAYSHNMLMVLKFVTAILIISICLQAPSVAQNYGDDPYGGLGILGEIEREAEEREARELVKIWWPVGNSPKAEKKLIPARQAIHQSLQRFAKQKRLLKGKLRSNTISAAQFDKSIDAISKWLISDFGRIYRGRTFEEANQISYQYEMKYLNPVADDGFQMAGVVINDRIVELVDNWQVRSILFNITNGDPRVDR